MHPSITSFKTTQKQWTKSIKGNERAPQTVRKGLLRCGIFSSLLYVAMNIFVPMLYQGYSVATQTVSELSAIDAPTRPLWVWLGLVYTVLVIAFGWGVWASAGGRRTLRTAGALLVAHGIIGLAWPLAPMHQREVLTAGGGTFTDTLHIVFSMVTVVIMLLTIAFAAAALDKRFRLYSMATILLLVATGALTGMDAPRMEAGQSTPWMGVWERISIGVYMLWVVVLATKLLRTERQVQGGPASTEKGA